MNMKSEGKKRIKAEKQAAEKRAVNNITDDTLGMFDFRAIKDEEKSQVKFNDGHFAFTIRFTGLAERAEGRGALYTVAMFRTMTDLSEEEFKAKYPVVQDSFWHGKGNSALEVTEKILRADWEQKLKGTAIFNDGERAAILMLCSDGREGADGVYRSDTGLSKEEFLAEYPVEPGTNSLLAIQADEFFEAVANIKREFEAGRQQVVEITKQHGFVEKKCSHEGCDGRGYTLEDESDAEAIAQAFYRLHDALHAAGFHHNAADAYQCAKTADLLFIPEGEKPATAEAVAA